MTGDRSESAPALPEAPSAPDIVELIPGLAWAADRRGRLTRINARLRDFMTASRLATAEYPDIFYSFDRIPVYRTWLRAVRTGQDFSADFRLPQGGQGTYRWFRALAHRQEDGSWLGTMLEITDQKRAHYIVETSEQNLQMLVDTIPALVWAVDAQGEPDYINKQMSNYYFGEQREIDHDLPVPDTRLRQALDMLMHPDDADRIRETLLESTRTGASFKMYYRNRRHDGVYRWVEARAEPLRDADGKILKWYGVSTDIEELVVSQEQARRSEQELRTILASIPALVACSTEEGDVTYFNARWAEEGFSEDDVRAGAAAVVHPEDYPRYMAVRAQGLATDEPHGAEVRLRRADGEYRWYLMRALATINAAGEPPKIYVSATYIHDRVMAEAALKARERELQLMVNAGPAMIWSMSPDGNPQYVNQQLERYYGVTPADLDVVDGSRLLGGVGMQVHKDDQHAVGTAMRRSLATGEPFAMRYRTFRADGQMRWVEARMEPLRDESGKIIRWYGNITDINDQIVAQEKAQSLLLKLSRASHLVSLGSLAHEVGQPLAAISSNAYTLQRYLAAEPWDVQKIVALAERIERNAHDAGDVVSRVRGVFRQDPLSRHAIDINTVVGDVRELMLTDIMANGISFKPELGAVPSVLADRLQVQQVLVNLLRNAIDAMKLNDGPRPLVVRTRLDDEGMVRTEVADHGAGVADPDRIFEPFYTTKADGMGLGLSICRQIIEDHQGRMWVTDNAPRGTVFSFTLRPDATAESRQ